MSVRAYTARSMTGEKWESLILRARYDQGFLFACNIEAIDPVLAEVASMDSIQSGVVGEGKWSNPEELAVHWARDKKLIRRAHVLIDFSPEAKSEGISHEIGYARYALWMPVIRVYPRWAAVPSYSVALFEDDVVVGSIESAVQAIHDRWGTWWKRAKWRAAMYLRSYPKYCWRKLGMWK